MLRYKYKHRSEKYWSFNKYSKVIIEISIVLIKAVELRYFRLCAEEEGFLREQAPDCTPHQIPAQAGYRGEYLQPSVPETGRVYQYRLSPAEEIRRHRGRLPTEW